MLFRNPISCHAKILLSMRFLTVLTAFIYRSQMLMIDSALVFFLSNILLGEFQTYVSSFWTYIIVKHSLTITFTFCNASSWLMYVVTVFLFPKLTALSCYLLIIYDVSFNNVDFLLLICVSCQGFFYSFFSCQWILLSSSWNLQWRLYLPIWKYFVWIVQYSLLLQLI